MMHADVSCRSKGRTPILQVPRTMNESFSSLGAAAQEPPLVHCCRCLCNMAACCLSIAIEHHLQMKVTAFCSLSDCPSHWFQSQGSPVLDRINTRRGTAGQSPRMPITLWALFQGLKQTSIVVFFPSEPRKRSDLMESPKRLITNQSVR